MNTIKYRPVGKSGPIVRVRVTQKMRTRTRYPDGQKHRAYPAQANRIMSNRGYVKVNP